MIQLCRIGGISYKDTDEDLSTAQIAAILFPAMVKNGPHAFGWVQWVPKDGISWQKYPGRCDSEWALENIINGVSNDACWAIFHSRWATTGSPLLARNNHPILHGNVIGVHNGVLQGYNEILAQTGREDPKSEVDSEAIFASVNKWGHTKGLRKIEGSMVAVYSTFDDPETIYIARSVGRQLTLGWTSRGNMIFASDKEALLRLEPDIVFKRFSQISEDRVLAVQYGEITNRRTFRRRKPVEVAPVAVGSVSNPAQIPSTERLLVGGYLYGQGREMAVREYLERKRDEKNIKRLFPNGEPTKKADQ